MARKVKLYIKSNNPKQKLSLPAIPFWLVSFLLNISIVFNINPLKNNNMDKYVTGENPSINSNPISELDMKNIKTIFNIVKKELRSYKKFDLVNIESSQGDNIKITIL